MLDLASKINTSSKAKKFDETQVDGGVQPVCVNCEEDYLVTMAFIAEQYTFKRAIDLETLNIERERNQMVDLLLQLLNFK